MLVLKITIRITQEKLTVAMLGRSPSLSTPFRTFYDNRTECTQVICYGLIYQPRKVAFLLYKYTPQSIRILLVEIYYIRLYFASGIGHIFEFCSVFLEFGPIRQGRAQEETSEPREG